MADDAAGTPLLVFADDWGRHPSSCQHLVRRLLPAHPVCWVNTIMRPPRLERATFARALGKLRQWSRPGRALRDVSNPRVLNPRMWPWFRTRLDRWLNRRLLTRQLSEAIAAMPRPPIAVTTVPIVADLLGALPVSKWVYYCVDDFSEWPGLDAGPLRAMERTLVARAGTLIAVSETLQTKLAGLGRAAELLTHGVDLSMWKSETTEPPPIPVGELEPPLIIFWGVIDQRMDTEFVRRLARDLEGGTIVLVGPQSAPAPELLRLPRVVAFPGVPFETLAALARHAAALIMPYADLPVTRAIQPLKLKEYLATGKPVVVRDLPANRPWADCLDLAASAEQFSEAVRRRVSAGTPRDQQAARERLAGESWEAKARRFTELLFQPSEAKLGIAC
jgi:glycosyltransferase involved in cell wall biosynthesis